MPASIEDVFELDVSDITVASYLHSTELKLAAFSSNDEHPYLAAIDPAATSEPQDEYAC